MFQTPHGLRAREGTSFFSASESTLPLPAPRPDTSNFSHSLGALTRGAARGGSSNQSGPFKKPLGLQPPHYGPSCHLGDTFCPSLWPGIRVPVPSPSGVLDRLTYSRFICISKLFLNYAGQSALPVAKTDIWASACLRGAAQGCGPRSRPCSVSRARVQKRQASRSLWPSAVRLLSGRMRTTPSPLSQAGQEPRRVKGQS